MVTKLYRFLVMARGAEPAAPATEGQEILMMAIWAFNACEALVKITAFKVFIHYMRYYRTIKPVLLLKKFAIAFFELNKVAIQKFP